MRLAERILPRKVVLNKTLGLTEWNEVRKVEFTKGDSQTIAGTKWSVAKREK
jgi:hypothetical protein